MSAVVLLRGLNSHFAPQQLEENGYHTKVSFHFSYTVVASIKSFLRTLTACCNNRSLLRRQKKRLSSCGQPLLLCKIWYKSIKITTYSRAVPTIVQ